MQSCLWCLLVNAPLSVSRACSHEIRTWDWSLNFTSKCRGKDWEWIHQLYLPFLWLIQEFLHSSEKIKLIKLIIKISHLFCHWRTLLFQTWSVRPMYRFEGHMWICKKINNCLRFEICFPLSWGKQKRTFWKLLKKKGTHLHTQIQRTVVES